MRREALLRRSRRNSCRFASDKVEIKIPALGPLVRRRRKSSLDVLTPLEFEDRHSSSRNPHSALRNLGPSRLARVLEVDHKSGDRLKALVGTTSTATNPGTRSQAQLTALGRTTHRNCGGEVSACLNDYCSAARLVARGPRIAPQDPRKTTQTTSRCSRSGRASLYLIPRPRFRPGGPTSRSPWSGDMFDRISVAMATFNGIDYV